MIWRFEFLLDSVGHAALFQVCITPGSFKWEMVLQNSHLKNIYLMFYAMSRKQSIYS